MLLYPDNIFPLITTTATTHLFVLLVTTVQMGATLALVLATVQNTKQSKNV